MTKSCLTTTAENAKLRNKNHVTNNININKNFGVQKKQVNQCRPEDVVIGHVVVTRKGSIITIPPITITRERERGTITHSCNQFSIAIISACNRYDCDYNYIAAPKLKNDFVTAITKSKLINK